MITSKALWLMLAASITVISVVYANIQTQYARDAWKETLRLETEYNQLAAEFATQKSEAQELLSYAQQNMDRRDSLPIAYESCQTK